MPYKVLYLPLWIKVINFIYIKKKCYIRDIDRQTGIGYNNTHLIVTFFVKKGIVTRYKKGRLVIIELTDTGLKIGESTHKLISALSSGKVYSERVTNVKFVPIEKTTP